MFLVFSQDVQHTAESFRHQDNILFEKEPQAQISVVLLTDVTQKANYADHSEKLLYSPPLFPLLAKEGIWGG
jgi:hypothetical protein